jgi:hypothetical protein
MAAMARKTPDVFALVTNARRIVDFRNQPIHDYPNVNNVLVWAIADRDVSRFFALSASLSWASWMPQRDRSNKGIGRREVEYGREGVGRCSCPNTLGATQASGAWVPARDKTIRRRLAGRKTRALR